MKFVIFAILIMLLAVMTIGNLVYEQDSEENITRDIYNWTESRLQWNSSQFQPEFHDKFVDVTNLDYEQLQSRRISNVIYKYVDFMGYALFQVVKWGMEFGYTHPQYNFEWIMDNTIKLLKYYVIFLCLLAAGPLLVPSIACIYILCVWIKKAYLWIKDRWRNKNGT